MSDHMEAVAEALWWELRRAFVTTNGGAFLDPQTDLLQAALSKPTVQAALAASRPPVTCGRVLIGRGSDTWDPTCVLPAGHEGACQPEDYTNYVPRPPVSGGAVEGLPADLAQVLLDPSIPVGDDVFKLVAAYGKVPSNTVSAWGVEEWKQAWLAAAKRIAELKAQLEHPVSGGPEGDVWFHGNADVTDAAIANLRKRRSEAKAEGMELTDGGIVYAVFDALAALSRVPADGEGR